MMIASTPTIFYLADGSSLIVAAGTRWETIGKFVSGQGRDAVTEYQRLSDRLDEIRRAIDAARALHGQDPIDK